jgi:proteasome accessory factor C
VSEALDERLGRLLLLVPFVLRNPGATVDEICKRFGIKKRQLASDIELLFLCGRPGYGPGELIEAEIVGDHVSIRTAEYFDKPFRLTPEEGLALYAGAQALIAAGSGDESLRRGIKRLEEALGPEALSRVRVGLESPPELRQVTSALDQRRRIRIVYQSTSKEEITERDVDPWTVFASLGRWYLFGWCHLVKDSRVFRVDRMLTVTILEETADVPDDLDSSMLDARFVKGPDSIKVVLDLAPKAAYWVTRYYPLEATEQLADGWLRVTLYAGGVAWLERILLSLGTNVRILEPLDLKGRIRELACRVAVRYSTPLESRT